MEHWPSWRYHAKEEARVFKSAEELAAAGPGWHKHWKDAVEAPERAVFHGSTESPKSNQGRRRI